MPEIDLLQPTVFAGVIQRMEAPVQFNLLNSVPQTAHPFPTLTWDVLQGSRMIAKPNVPNAEAHIVPRLGRDQQSASFVYLREKKVFEPTTIRWLREPGQIARTNAEAAVMREVMDLNQRFDGYAEWLLWQALTGSIDIVIEGATTKVDYKFLTSHKPTVTGKWSTAEPKDIAEDIKAWKRLIRRDGGVEADTVWCTPETLDHIVDSYTGGTNNVRARLMSDRMKETFFSTGVLDGFLGMMWRQNDDIFDFGYGERDIAGKIKETNADGTLKNHRFLGNDALVMGNFSMGRPIELYVGPTADDEAPMNHTGKFAKTWKEKDPSARQYLIEWNIMPVITRPDQFVYVADVNPS